MGRKIRIGVVFIALVAIISGIWLHRHTTQFDEIISQTAFRHSIDFYLLKAVIYEESWFRPDIRGGAGEVGLMQVTMAAAADYAAEHGFLPFYEDRLLEPMLNLEIGCWYLAKSLEKYKNTPNPELFALLRYNAGESRADKWLKLALAQNSQIGALPEEHYLSFVDFPQTRDYAKRVLKRARSKNFWF